MASPRKELLGTVLAGRYELTEIIGEGGMVPFSGVTNSEWAET